jgi:glucose/arabinose dehydrogenase
MNRIVMVVLLLLSIIQAKSQMVPHRLQANGKEIRLNLPAGYDVRVALDGLKRVRFLTKAPDGRIFATDMFSQADNKRGQVLILDGWNASTNRFTRAVPYLQHLRNPNSITFFTDGSGQTWLYVALTDRLVRYRYKAGDEQPTSEPEVLAHYPDYGLDYKYGGWHLTRTVAFGSITGKPRMFVSVGSSCNACAEKEAVRATISVMDPDGGHSMIIVKNIRNAVGLLWDDTSSSLLATNMGDDQLGDKAPEDTLLQFSAAEIAAASASGKPINAGWPACYVEGGKIHPDPDLGKAPGACAGVKLPLTGFAAHSSPLGLEKLAEGDYLIALHGAGHPRVGTGYRVVSVAGPDWKPKDFMTGFLETSAGRPHVSGRPCGILKLDTDRYLITDDLLGAIYVVFRSGHH